MLVNAYFNSKGEMCLCCRFRGTLQKILKLLTLVSIELKMLKQKGTLEDYITKFQLLAARSGITEDISLVEYFIDRLKSDLVRAI